MNIHVGIPTNIFLLHNFVVCTGPTVPLRLRMPQLVLLIDAMEQSSLSVADILAAH
jgi:hypothetical protein